MNTIFDMVSKSILVKIAIGIVAVVCIWCLFKMFFAQKNMTAVPVAESIPVTLVPTATLPEKFAPYDPEDDGNDNLLENYAEFIPAEVEREDYVDAADVYASPDSSSQLLDDY